MGEVSGSRVCIFLGNLPSGPALGQQTSQQHQKGAMPQKVFVWLNIRTVALLELGICMVKGAEELGGNWFKK